MISIEPDKEAFESLDADLIRFPRVLREELKNELLGLMFEAKRWMIVERLTGGTTKTRLKPVTGNLIASIRTRVTVSAGEILAQVVQDQRFRSRIYGPVHEYGAIIRPKRAQYLTIPLDAEAAARGIRYFRNRIFFIPIARNKLLAMLKPKGFRKAYPMFLLVKRVRIPARWPFGATMDYIAPKARATVERVVERVIRRSLAYGLRPDLRYDTRLE